MNQQNENLETAIKNLVNQYQQNEMMTDNKVIERLNEFKRTKIIHQVFEENESEINTILDAMSESIEIQNFTTEAREAQRRSKIDHARTYELIKDFKSENCEIFELVENINELMEMVRRRKSKIDDVVSILLVDNEEK